MEPRCLDIQGGYWLVRRSRQGASEGGGGQGPGGTLRSCGVLLIAKVTRPFNFEPTGDQGFSLVLVLWGWQRRLGVDGCWKRDQPFGIILLRESTNLK